VKTSDYTKNIFSGYKSVCTLANELNTPWNRVFLEELTVEELVKKFSALCGT
jgi:hypothetical protein